MIEEKRSNSMNNISIHIPKLQPEEVQANLKKLQKSGFEVIYNGKGKQGQDIVTLSGKNELISDCSSSGENILEALQNLFAKLSNTTIMTKPDKY